MAPPPVRGHNGPSVIGAGLSVIGRLDCAGDIQIEGTVEGEVRGHGVRIGSGAVVKGTVAGEIVQLAGMVEGTIEAETVILTKTACVSGDIHHRSLQIEEGAYFSGSSHPGLKQAASPSRVEVSDSEMRKGPYVAPGNPIIAPAPVGAD
jgi:cytoskeletal protein CcmA (bactofilin family)